MFGRIRLSVAALLLAVGLLVCPHSAAQDNREELIELHRRATAAYDAGEMETALELNLELWRRLPTYDTALNIAAINFRLERYALAAEYARSALDDYPPTSSEETRDSLVQMFKDARAEVGAVRVDAPEGAEVKVDGRVVGTAPVRDVFVEPGTHTFTARAGALTDTKTATVEKGGSTSVELRLQSPPDEQPPPDEPPTTDETKQGPSPQTLVIAAGSVLTVVSLGVHVGFISRGSKLDDDADKLRTEAEKELGPNGCARAEESVCSELKDTLEKRKRAASWQRVTLATSITFAAVTATAVLWPRRQPRENAISVQPWVSTGSGGFFVEGRF